MFCQRSQTFQQVGQFQRCRNEHRLRLIVNILNFDFMSVLRSELLALKVGAESMPAPNEIGRILSFVSKGTPYDQFFFEKLNDPAWLPVLDSNGYFSNLPSIKTIQGGSQLYPHHLPLIGLARLAKSAPLAVTSILVKLELPENPTIGNQVLQCLSLIREPSCIPVLHPLLIQLGEQQKHPSWVWIQDLLKNWIEAKAFSDVLVVVNSYLTATAGSFDPSLPLDDAWVIQQVDSIALEQLTSDFPLQIATIVFNALARRAAKEHVTVTRAPQSDDVDVDAYFGNNASAAFWLDDFKSAPNHREFEPTLAHRLFVAAERIYRQGDTKQIEMIDQLLRSNSLKLFQRLRWQLYADFSALSRERARKDVVERIPFVNRFEFEHTREFAQMLRVHAKQGGDAFLLPEEVARLFSIVMSGPIDKSGEILEGHYRDVFRHKQLWPISSLLRGDQLAAYQNFVPESDKTNFNSYKPYRSGGIETHLIQDVPRPVGNNLAALSDQKLWHVLNHRQPEEKSNTGNDWWDQENVGILATEFAELLENDPQRFSATTKWWEHLKRPEHLIKPLERAIQRIKNNQNENPKIPNDNDWVNWFGIAEWIVALSATNSTARQTKQHQISDGESEWYWPRIVVADFLEATIQTSYAGVNQYLPMATRLLRALIEGEDARVQGHEDSFKGDWLGTAINTVRGRSIEGIIKLALRQKNATTIL